MVQPYFSEMDEFCVAVERLLRRILTDEDWDEEAIKRMSRWFSLWFNSLGMTLSYVQEVNKQDYDGDDKQTRWRVSLYHHQFHDRSYFYVFEDNDSAPGFASRTNPAGAPLWFFGWRSAAQKTTEGLHLGGACPGGASLRFYTNILKNLSPISLHKSLES